MSDESPFAKCAREMAEAFDRSMRDLKQAIKDSPQMFSVQDTPVCPRTGSPCAHKCVSVIYCIQGSTRGGKTWAMEQQRDRHKQNR